jgi:uncharacterized hydantoinase/oxoprolinase family protein
MTILEKIQALVRLGNIEHTYHAIEEKLSEINYRHGLNLNEEDIKSVILTGEIIDIIKNDKRGVRYAIAGIAVDNQTALEIVCRIRNNVVKITVYEPYI